MFWMLMAEIDGWNSLCVPDYSRGWSQVYRGDTTVSIRVIKTHNDWQKKTLMLQEQVFGWKAWQGLYIEDPATAGSYLELLKTTVLPQIEQHHDLRKCGSRMEFPVLYRMMFPCGVKCRARSLLVSCKRSNKSMWNLIHSGYAKLHRKHFWIKAYRLSTL